MDSVTKFAGAAAIFERWLLSGTDRGADAVRECLIRLLELYRAGLDLPPEWSGELEGRKDVERVGGAERRRANEAAQRIPIDLYAVVLDPTVVPSDAPVIGSVSDDLADIYCDVATGLRAYERGDRAGAVWEWSFGLHSHWGTRRWTCRRRAALASRSPQVIANVRWTLRSLVMAAITYSDDFAVDEFLSLASRVWPGAYSRGAASQALGRTLNVGARDDGRLIGSIRILTDGYFFATIPEILVDPDYQRRGIGRELMERGLQRARRHKAFFGAQPQSVAFFERIGCERTLTGFVAQLPLGASPHRAAT